ncbi:exodeoxyribonuclease VII large subunit, partial [Dubosiella newyorkensis]
MSIKVVAVSALLTRIKQIVTSTVVLDGIWIRGEVSNLTKHRSGHYYFSLKDHGGEMSCVMFASAVGRMNFALEEGMQILVLANVNIYEARGSLQLYVKEIR